jgi:hypothetical protein
MAHHKLLRLSATLLFIGVVVTVVLFLLHPQGATTDLVTFTVFANSSSWTAIHLGEFVGMALILAGLLVLYFALNVSEGTARWLGFFGAVAAGVAVALYGVAFAVDGVALKQAVDAWASAPAAEQAARFASAQAMLVLFATTIVWTARISRPIGYFMGVIGLAFLVVGWLEGTVGFSPTYGITVLITYLFLLPVWSIWMLIIAWWRKESVQAAPA